MPRISDIQAAFIAAIELNKGLPLPENRQLYRKVAWF